MNTGLRWILTFFVILFLTQDYFFFDWKATPTWLGFPNWLGWFVSLHLLLVMEFLRFQKKYWK